MESNRSEHLYSVLFDERQETWFVKAEGPGHLPLARSALQDLVSLYNEIHRGAPLALIERRAMEELGAERTELRETIRSLYDYIDTETDPMPVLPATTQTPKVLRILWSFKRTVRQMLWPGIR
jgi:hypothetical protein